MDITAPLILAFTGLGILAFFSLWPLNTSIIRYRAHYAPLIISLPSDDSEPTSISPTSSQIRGLWQLIKRVKQQEGWSGFWRGIIPTMLQALLVGSVSIVLWAITRTLQFPAPGEVQREPYLVLVKVAGSSFLSMMLFLPFEVIITRAIATPYRLSYLKPLGSLHVLLSPTELRAPWMIYTLPGLVLSKILLLAYPVLLVPVFRNFISPVLFPYPGKITVDPATIAGVVASVVFLLVSIAIVCPLEVISLRLQLKPQASGVALDSDIQDGTAPLYGKKENVIQLRSSESALGGRYKGVLDCGRKICREEGWRTLGRVWWITALSLLSTGCAWSF